MPKITYRTHEGATSSHIVEDGISVMQAALNNGHTGVVAECGGSMMCATCHVYVDEVWLSRLPPITETEEAMLTMTVAERRPNSRLSCQIIMTPGLDGIAIEIPDMQV